MGGLAPAKPPRRYNTPALVLEATTPSVIESKEGIITRTMVNTVGDIKFGRTTEHFWSGSHYRSKVGKNRLTSGCSKLMYACQQGLLATVVQELRTKPERIRQRDSSSKNVLHYCSGQRDLVAAASVAVAAPDLLESADEDGFTPLHLAVIQGNLAMVNLLLANKADVNAVDNEGHSVVHWATVCGEVEALRAVLQAGANVKTPDINGGSPLHYAAQMCGATYDGKLTQTNSTKLALEILDILLAHPQSSVDVTDKDGRKPLLWAASAGSAKAVLALVKAGSRIESADKDGLTALHCAASRGHTECIDTLTGLCGAPTDLIDSNGCTALHYAVTLGHADATSRLLDLEADPNRQDRKGRTPAHCGCSKGQLETVKLLKEWGANLWLRNAKGDLPLHEAASSGRRELVEWLLEQKPKHVNTTSNDGRSLLHIASSNDYSDICKLLIDYGADVNSIWQTSKGVAITPLDCALQRGYRSTAKYLQSNGGLPASKLRLSAIHPNAFVEQDVVKPLKYVEKEENRKIKNYKICYTHLKRSDSDSSGHCSCSERIYKKEHSYTHMCKHHRKRFRRRTSSCGETKHICHQNSGTDICRSKSNIEIRRRPSRERFTSTDSELDSCENCCYHKKKHRLKRRERTLRKGRSLRNVDDDNGKQFSSDIKQPDIDESLRAKVLSRPSSGKHVAPHPQSEIRKPSEDQAKSGSPIEEEGESPEGTEQIVVTKADIHSTPKDLDTTPVEKREEPIEATDAPISSLQQSESIVGDIPKEIVSVINAAKCFAEEQIESLKVDEIIAQSPTTVAASDNTIPNDDNASHTENNSETQKQSLLDLKQKDSKSIETSKVTDDTKKGTVIEKDPQQLAPDNEVLPLNESTLSTTAEKEHSGPDVEEEKLPFDNEMSAEQFKNTISNESTSIIVQQPQPGQPLQETSTGTQSKEHDKVSEQIQPNNDATITTQPYEPKQSTEDVPGPDSGIVMASELAASQLLPLASESTPAQEPSKPLTTSAPTPSPAQPLATKPETPTAPTAVPTPEPISSPAPASIMQPIPATITPTPSPQSDTAQLRDKESRRSFTLLPDSPEDDLEAQLRKSSFQVLKSDESVDADDVTNSMAIPSERTFQIVSDEQRNAELSSEGEAAINGEEENDAGGDRMFTPHSITAIHNGYHECNNVRKRRLKKRIKSGGTRGRSHLKMLSKAATVQAQQQQQQQFSTKDQDSGFEPSPRAIHTKIPLPKGSSTPHVPRKAIYTTLDGRVCSSRLENRKPGDKNACDMSAVTRSIQRNIRRYYMERKIFQHLLDLKSLQIRSSKLNEAVLVKRAVGEYHKSCIALGGETGGSLRRYPYSEYTFKNFELFLYETLKSIQKPGTFNFQNINDVYEEAERRLSPDYNAYEKALQCTTKTHRCLHAAHAYTGIPCAAYIPMMNHHTIPKYGFGPYKKGGAGSFYLPKILNSNNSCTSKVSLEVSHGKSKQLISLPSEKLDSNKRYYVTFTVKETGGSRHPQQTVGDPETSSKNNDSKKN